MAKDVLITPAGGKVEFKDSGNLQASVYELNGNLYLNSKSGTVVLGDGTPTNIEVGNATTAVTFDFLGGGTISSSGNALNVGTAGDIVNLNISGVTYNYGNNIITTANYTAADVLTKLKTVDGLGSGLDADLLDGYSAALTSTANTIAIRDSGGNISATGIKTDGYYYANGASVITTITTTITTANTNMKGYVDGQISTTTTAITTANTNMKGYVDAGNTIQSNQIAGANAAITTANTNMKGYVDNALSSLSSNKISANSSNVTVTANFVNVAINSSNIVSVSSEGLNTVGILSVTGNITAGNIAAGGVRQTTSATAPTVNTVGDQWYDTDTDTLFQYVYDGSNYVWVDISGQPLNVNISTVQGTSLSITGNGTVGGALSTGSGSVSGGLSVGGDLTANQIKSSNSTATSLTSGAAIFNGGTGAILFDDAGHKRISWNDNSGNFNIRAGNYNNGTSLVYTKGLGDSNSGAASITFSSDGVDGAIAFNTAPIGVPGAAVSWAQSMTLNASGLSLTAGVFSGTATSARYADLAENYTADAEYPPGTVLVFGGDKEVTQSTSSHDTAVAGVVSTNPAYLMNSEQLGVSVALTGRVPCWVTGPINKGDRVVSSDKPGVAERLDMAKYQPGCIIGKSLETIETKETKLIEVVVGRI